MISYTPKSNSYLSGNYFRGYGNKFVIWEDDKIDRKKVNSTIGYIKNEKKHTIQFFNFNFTSMCDNPGL